MSSENTPPDDEDGSLLPAALGGAGILIAAALLIFWPADTESDRSASKEKVATSKDGSAKKAGAGGVTARQYDEASSPDKTSGPRRNPAIRLPQVGMAPNPPPSEPPTFETPEEELAWHQKQLVAAERNLEMRKQAVVRLGKMTDRIDSGPNPDQALKAHESRAQIVKDNLSEAEKKVTELKQKISQLGG